MKWFPDVYFYHLSEYNSGKKNVIVIENSPDTDFANMVLGLSNNFGMMRINKDIENFTENEKLFIKAHEMHHFLMDHHLQLSNYSKNIPIGFMFYEFTVYFNNWIRHEYSLRFQPKLAPIPTRPTLFLGSLIAYFGIDLYNNYCSRLTEYQADKAASTMSEDHLKGGIDFFNRLIPLDHEYKYHKLPVNWFRKHPFSSERLDAIKNNTNI